MSTKSPHYALGYAVGSLEVVLDHTKTETWSREALISYLEKQVKDIRQMMGDDEDE